MFSNYGASDIFEAKGIEDLINDFSANTHNFKQSMQSLDFGEKLKQNNRASKLQDWITDNQDVNTSISKLPKDCIRIANKKIKMTQKSMPVKAERLVIKKSMLKTVNN